ncbi:ABC transporter permease [Georgenia yuyongxinii]
MSTAKTQQAAQATGVTEQAPRLQIRWQQFMIFGALIVLIIAFSIASPNFLTVSNAGGIMLAAAVTGILALGTSFVIATGGIDLSVGTTMTLVSVMLAVFGTSNYLGLPFVVAVVLALVFGALLGLLVGFFVAHLGIPPFIATLAMMMATQGASLIITGSTPQYFTEIDGFRNLATGQLIPKLPNAVLIFLVLAVVAWFLMNKTLIGRYAVSIGSNEEATKISGVNTRRWKLYIYLTAFVFTAIAGVLMASRLNSAQPALGPGYELEAIAAVVIGGTSLAGGRASIIGTVVGATLMATLNNGLQILGIAQEWQRIAVAVVIIIAVWADTVRRRRSGEA